MIITRKNKKVSLFGALLISFSPVFQWFFVPHAEDVFFWGMAIVVLAYHFFMVARKTRFWLTPITTLALVGFVIALYPPLQVPIVFFDIALLIGLLIRDKKQITFKKKDAWFIAAGVVYTAVVLIYTLITSKDAIFTLLNTTYPGKRVSLGANETLSTLFTNLVSFTLPFKEITYSNSCEISNFIHFAPIFLILYPVIFKKLKKDKNMIIGNILVGAIAISVVFMFAGFPKLLAKLTLFSYADRMSMVYGFIATIFTVWGIDMIWKKKILNWKHILIALGTVAFLYFCFIGKSELTYLHLWQYCVIIFGLTLLGFLMLKRHKITFLVLASSVVLLAGATVNPIARGMSPLFEHPLEKKIHEIAENDKDAYWLAINDNRLSSIGIANGARVLDAVNFYPDFGKWKLIDENEENKDIYNRYAHIALSLTTDETQFTPGRTDDIFMLQLNYDDLLKTPVKYLVTAGRLDENQASFEEIYIDAEGDYHIYERKIE